jgi:hypothetical protein
MPCIKMEKVYEMTRLQDVLMGNRKACILGMYYIHKRIALNTKGMGCFYGKNERIYYDRANHR